MESKKSRRTFRAGSVRASVWDNEVVINGQKTNVPKICVDRRYKNQEGEWLSSNHFSINELAKLQTVVRAAFDYLVLAGPEDGLAGPRDEQQGRVFVKRSEHDEQETGDGK